MEKLPRVTAKIFASNANSNDIGQYGSALTGNKVLTSDIAEIQALPAYEVGWRDAVLSNRNYPTLQEMNGLQKTFSQQIAYCLQNGMPEWDEGTEYYTSQFCRINNTFYYSLTDNNIGNNPLTDTTNWRAYTSPIPIATSNTLGGVIPDGNSILVDNSGKISVNQTPLDNRFVNVTGDTITGNLNLVKTTPKFTIENTNTSAGVSGLYIKSNSFDITTASSLSLSSVYYGGALFFTDKNDQTSGALRNQITTANTMVTQITASQSIGGTVYTANVSANVDKNGNAFASCPTPPANSNRTDIATTAWVRSLIASNGGVAEYTFGTNSGRIVTNYGLIIQWGRGSHNANRTPVTITMNKAFKSATSYRVFANGEEGTFDGDISYGAVGAKPVTTTTFTCWNERSQNYPAYFSWFAIGN